MSVTMTYGVTGMTCDHCVKAVAEEVSALDGVTSVQIDLVADGVTQVSVTSAEPLERGRVAEAVDEAGYELAGV